ncbi:MAG: glycosyltransferase [Candidatus Omnitrophica bacterium]|nr:glycosyltransferase [Candidatus Omnitrophota bacterium]
MTSLAEHYDKLALKRDAYKSKHKYYYSLLYKQYRYFIPDGKKVLEVGCSTGDLLNAVKPSLGLGIDISAETIKIAKHKYPHLIFETAEVGTLKLREQFDFIILSGVLGEVEDIQKLLEQLKPFCHRGTRIIIEYYSYYWQYILKFGEMMWSKIPQKIQNWVTAEDLLNFFELAGYEPIQQERAILLPFNIWGISYLINRFIAKLPIINTLTLNHFFVVRPIITTKEELSVSILVPCRNEKGNIESAVTRTPVFGKHQEFMFVEGHSKDGTYEEVERIIKKYPNKDIKLFRQPGKGKGDAVRFGFNKSSGDVLMILDADLTVAPEELPKFYDVMRDNRAEFVNGCRLVYPMESEAMRFLNLCANKFFGLFFSWLLGQRFRDTLCGTKVISKKNYEELAANRAYFGDFDPFGDFDLIFGAAKMNLKIMELPIRYRSRAYGTTQIQRFRHGLLLFKMCFFAMRKIKFR